MQMEQPPIGLWRWAMDAIQKIDGGDVWTPNGIIRVEGYPPTRLRGLCTAIKTTLDEAETDAPTSVADDQILMVPYDRPREIRTHNTGCTTAILMLSPRAAPREAEAAWR